MISSVGEAEVHRAVSCLGDVHAVRGVRSGGLRGSRDKSLGSPAERTRGAVLQALLVIESGQVEGLRPRCFLRCDGPVPGENVGEVVQPQAELPIPDRNPEPPEAERDSNHGAGYRATGGHISKERVKSWPARGLIHAEQELLAL